MKRVYQFILSLLFILLLSRFIIHIPIVLAGNCNCPDGGWTTCTSDGHQHRNCGDCVIDNSGANNCTIGEACGSGLNCCQIRTCTPAQPTDSGGGGGSTGTKPTCTSWTSIKINSCTSSKWSDTPRSADCKVGLGNVTLHLDSPKATQMMLKNTDDSQTCANVSFSGVAKQNYVTTLSWSLEGTGARKVCAKFSNDVGNSSQCGGKIYVDSSLPTSTPAPTVTPGGPTVTPGGPTATPTPTSGPTPTPNPNCLCQNNTCASACTYEKFDSSSGFTYTDPLKCGLTSSVFPSTPSSDNQTAWCRAVKRTKGDADANYVINLTDYYYYVAAVNGGKIPVGVNPDFNGDGEIGASDRAIIIKSLNP